MIRNAILASMAVLACGCASLADMRDKDIAAEQLSVKPEDVRTPPTTGVKNYLGSLVLESQQKCDAFLKRLVSGLQTLNAAGDVATTVFSALGSVFTPVNTVHGLTAASTIASGTKNSLLADVYAKASIANFQVAIQQTYSTQLAQYNNALPNLDENRIVVASEVSKIQSIHSLCGIAQAEATIAATLAPSAAKASGITVAKSFNPASVQTGHTSTLTLTLGNASGGAAALTAPFVDAFPPGLVIAPTPNLGGTCQAASVTSSAGQVKFDSGAQIPVGGCTITVAVTAAKAGSYENKLAANALQTNQGSNAADVAATLTVTAAEAGAHPAPVPAPAPAPAPITSAAPAQPANQNTQSAVWGRPLR